MKTPVSIKDKKLFIQWFLENYQLKKRESVWILNYLINHEYILKHIHFVREAKFCPRSMIMSTYCSNEVPFRFYRNHVVTTDVEKSYHDLRMNRHEALYIELNFKDSRQNLMYLTVLEENPFIPDDYFITEKDKDHAKQLLEEILYQQNKKLLEQKIDEALDHRNKELFLQLSKQYKRLRDK